MTGGMASFEDRLTMVLAAEYLKVLVESEVLPVNPEKYGKEVVTLVRGVVQARKEDHENRFAELLAQAPARLGRFQEAPAGAIPHIAFFANQCGALEECLAAMVMTNDIGILMRGVTPVTLAPEHITKVFRAIEEAKKSVMVKVGFGG